MKNKGQLSIEKNIIKYDIIKPFHKERLTNIFWLALALKTLYINI